MDKGESCFWEALGKVLPSPNDMNHLVVSLVVLVARLGGVLSLLCRLLSGKSIRKSSARRIYGLAVTDWAEHLTGSEVGVTFQLTRTTNWLPQWGHISEISEMYDAGNAEKIPTATITASMMRRQELYFYWVTVRRALRELFDNVLSVSQNTSVKFCL